MSRPVPDWLLRAREPRHFNLAMSSLDDRELIRVRARVPKEGRQISLKHRLGIVSHAPAHDPLTDHYSTATGCSPENHCSNRYADIEPYDRTIVPSAGRYFNANWVREHAGGRWTIATQAPLRDTAHDFLSIIVGLQTLRPPDGSHSFSRVRTVVQLTQNVENGRRKADVYFPTTPGHSWVVTPKSNRLDLPPIRVTLDSVKTYDDAHCTLSKLSVSVENRGPIKPLTFRHLLFHAWPDHGVPQPESRAGLLNFVRLVERTNRDVSHIGMSEPNPDPEPPIMINCSAGVGRTGSFIALSSLLRAYALLDAPPSHLSLNIVPPALPASPLGPLPDHLRWDRIAQEIDALREQRPGMVQRPEQALLVYEVLYSAFRASPKGSRGIHA
ncbi:protein-tyrosine phosphatase-like protein [Amylostereum chailletii]|nr:protein-tyrosine phosphatase-like protein [Amylostereum chailletii]